MGTPGRKGLRESVSALIKSPLDIGDFVDVSLALLSEDREAGFRALSSLASSANRTGQVATAVLAAVLLRREGREDDAMGLLCEISDMHCLGSKRIDASAKAKPLSPPTIRSETIADEAELVEKALAAIDASAALYAEREPEMLAPTPLISGMEPEEFFDLAQLIEPKEYASGDNIVTEGDEAENLFWIARGRADVDRGGQQVGQLRSGAFFGEIALVGGTVRTATVKAASPLWALAVNRKSVEELAEQQQNMARTLVQYARSRLLSTIMSTSELFKRLSEGERMQIRQKFETEVFDAGATIVEKGSDSKCLYVLVSGVCEVRDGDEVIATLAIGDGVGEMSLLSQSPANADVVAVESSVMLALPRERFDEVVLEHPQLLAEVYKLLRDRSKDNKADVVHDASDLVIS